MESSSMVLGVPTDRERVIGELTRGREIADQLRAILRESRDSAGAESQSWSSVLPARSLVEKILHSFTQSLSMLNSVRVDSEDQVSHDDELASQVLNSPPLKPEDSGDSCKTPSRKDRRGCYNRRKSLETQTIESATLCEDGRAWRKYGQKVILNAKYPRNYFRCTHKFDQKCPATKYVQKIRDDPPLYRTTYHGHHTCKDLFKSPHQIIMEAASLHDDHEEQSPAAGPSIIWSFQPDPDTNTSCTSTNTFMNHQPTTPANYAIKQEHHQLGEYRAGRPRINNEFGIMNSPSSSPTNTIMTTSSNRDDYFVSTHDHHHEQLIVAALRHVDSTTTTRSAAAFSSEAGSQSHVDNLHDQDHGGDVYSCTASTHSHSTHDDLDHNLMVGSVFVDDVLLGFQSDYVCN